MATCANCGTSLPDGAEVMLGGKEGAEKVAVCSTCAFSIEKELKAETEDANLIGALVFGLGAAAIASAAWYGFVALTKIQFGLVAVGIGWLVGQGVMIGSGRKRGMVLQVMSVAIALVAMAASEYLVVRHFINAEGEMTLPLLLPLPAMLKLVMLSLKGDPLTLLFWAIALWTAFGIPAPRRLQRAATG